MAFKEWLKQQELPSVYDCEYVHGLMRSAWQAATETLCARLENHEPQLADWLRQQESAET